MELYRPASLELIQYCPKNLLRNDFPHHRMVTVLDSMISAMHPDSDSSPRRHRLVTCSRGCIHQCSTGRHAVFGERPFTRAVGAGVRTFVFLFLISAGDVAMDCMCWGQAASIIPQKFRQQVSHFHGVTNGLPADAPQLLDRD